MILLPPPTPQCPLLLLLQQRYTSLDGLLPSKFEQVLCRSAQIYLKLQKKR